jgi:2,3-dimethylmalate lyase
MGFAAAIYPTVGLFAASHVLASVYQALAQGEPVSDPLCAFGDFVDMIGFPTVWDFEKTYTDLLAEDQI